MTPTRITFANALGKHFALMLALRHDGQGLPSKGSSFVFMLMALQTVLTGVILLTHPDGTGASMASDFLRKTVWLICSYRFMALPFKCVEVFTGALLLSILQHIVHLVIVLLDLQTTLAGVLLIAIGWGLVAQISLLMRHIARIRPHKKTKK